MLTWFPKSSPGSYPNNCSIAVLAYTMTPSLARTNHTPSVMLSAILACRRTSSSAFLASVMSVAILVTPVICPSSRNGPTRDEYQMTP